MLVAGCGVVGPRGEKPSTTSSKNCRLVIITRVLGTSKKTWRDPNGDHQGLENRLIEESALCRRAGSSLGQFGEVADRRHVKSALRVLGRAERRKTVEPRYDHSPRKTLRPKPNCCYQMLISSS